MFAAVSLLRTPGWVLRASRPGLQRRRRTVLVRASASSKMRCPDKPAFHVAPRTAWLNDPNGPIYYGGRYHLFYQHVSNSCSWSFGLEWGHAVSSDLVHWEHLAPALRPTPGSPDADGCFSGCAVLDENGRPTILYTGVRLRSNPEAGPLPPPEYDLGLPFIEAQCVAVPEEGDDLLRVWVKREAPIIERPPAKAQLTGWRDPFIFETGGNGKEWGMLLGSGIKGKGGAVMIYRSKDLHSGWRFDGLLCESESSEETGIMWECPILVQLNRVPEQRLRPRGGVHLHAWSSPADALAIAAVQGGAEGLLPPPSPRDGAATAGGGALPTTDTLLASPKALLSYDDEDDSARAGGAPGAGVGLYHASAGLGGEDGAEATGPTHFFCVSPDAPTNPVLYWLGRYDAAASRFDMEGAVGPYRLDLGDIMYAPNMMTDERGRHLMWGWLQERRPVGSYEYSGCLSLPRALCLRGGRLVQEPAAEVAQLRTGEAWCVAVRRGKEEWKLGHASDLTVYPEQGTPLEVVGGQRLEVEVTLARGDSRAAGLHLRSWRADGEDAALLVDWERGVLQAVFTDGLPVDLSALHDLDPSVDGLRRVGGPVSARPGEPLTLRVFIDHSCVEVYASSGEVLSTRVYRGAPRHAADAGISLVAYGGAARVEHVAAWEMGSIWKDELLPAAAPIGAEPLPADKPLPTPVPVLLPTAAALAGDGGGAGAAPPLGSPLGMADAAALAELELGLAAAAASPLGAPLGGAEGERRPELELGLAAAAGPTGGAPCDMTDARAAESA